MKFLKLLLIKQIEEEISNINLCSEGGTLHAMELRKLLKHVKED